jgi:hypothetical protein
LLAFDLPRANNASPCNGRRIRHLPPGVSTQLIASATVSAIGFTATTTQSL